LAMSQRRMILLPDIRTITKRFFRLKSTESELSSGPEIGLSNHYRYALLARKMQEELKLPSDSEIHNSHEFVKSEGSNDVVPVIQRPANLKV
jgi:hypothetical protein